MSAVSQHKSKPRVAIVGAGVSGLTVAVALAETYGKQFELTIIAEKFSPDTTSDRAGALITPWITPAGDEDVFQGDVRKWAPTTFHHFKHLHRCNSLTGNENGIFRMPIYEFHSKQCQPASWLRALFQDYQELSKDEAKGMGLPYQGFESIMTYTMYLVRGTVYLPWLMRNFRERGGLITKRKIESFDELSTYDIIINCTGLGARELAGDRSMLPVRGQIVVVKATTPPQINGIYHSMEVDCSKFAHVFPFKDIILLGKYIFHFFQW